MGATATLIDLLHIRNMLGMHNILLSDLFTLLLYLILVLFIQINNAHIS